MCVCVCVVFAAPLSAAAGQQTWLRQLLKRAAKHQRGGHYREITRVLSFSLTHCAADCHNLFITYNVEKSMNDDEISAVSLIYLSFVWWLGLSVMYSFSVVSTLWQNRPPPSIICHICLLFWRREIRNLFAAAAQMVDALTPWLFLPLSFRKKRKEKLGTNHRRNKWTKSKKKQKKQQQKFPK